MVLVITPGTNYSATSILTSTNLKALVSAATIAGIDNTHIDSGTVSFVEIGSVPPAATQGRAWWDTSLKKFSIYDGTVFRVINPDFGATFPASDYEGKVYFDTTRDILGVYDNASWKFATPHYGVTMPEQVNGNLWVDTGSDGAYNIPLRLFGTRFGAAGYHGLAYQPMLVVNADSVTLPQYGMCSWSQLGSPLDRRVRMPFAVKDVFVAGVVLEHIGPGASGLIMPLADGALVTVAVNTITYDVAVNDVLASSISNSHFARSVGELLSGGTGQIAFGRPYGSFARALTAVTGGTTGLVTAQLFGSAGRGAQVLLENLTGLGVGAVTIAKLGETIPGGDTLTAANLTDNSVRTIDLTNNPSGDQFALSLKHHPYIAVEIDMALKGVPNAGNNFHATFDIGNVTSSPQRRLEASLQAPNSSPSFANITFTGIMIRCYLISASPAENKITIRGNVVLSGASILNAWQIAPISYVY